MDILAALRNGSTTALKVATTTGRSEKACARALRALWVAGKVTKQVFPSSPAQYALTAPRHAQETPALITAADVLRIVAAGEPCTAVAIAHAFRTAAKDVNPILYALRAAGEVVIAGTDGSKPIWAVREHS